MKELWELLASGTFWTAVGAVAALLAVVPLFFAAMRYLRQRQTGNLLARERAFYSLAAAKRDRELASRYRDLARHGIQEEGDIADRTAHYLRGVREGVEGLAALPLAEREKSPDDIRKLIAELRTTHQSLVEALELFGTEEAERFFKEFDSFKTKVTTIYNGGNIPASARTHCSMVEELAHSLTRSIKEGAVGREEIRELATSVVVMDREVIIPVMVSILERANTELELISHAIRIGEKRKALWMKERYWFDIQPMYDEIRSTLSRMDEVIDKFKLRRDA